MSSVFEGTELQIETIDSKPYLLQARAVFPDGTAGEWGPSAYLPEYVAPAGSIQAFDGTFEQYFSIVDAVNDGWAMTGGNSWAPAVLDTTAQLQGNNSLKLTANSFVSSDAFTLSTPPFDVYGGTTIRWSMRAKAPATNTFYVVINAYWVNNASAIPNTGSSVVNIYTGKSTDPISTDYTNGGVLAVPSGAERMIIVYSFYAISGQTYPKTLYIDDLINVGVVQQPVDTTNDQIIFGAKYFESLAADTAHIDNFDADNARVEDLTGTSADFQILNVNGQSVGISGKQYLLQNDYPRISYVEDNALGGLNLAVGDSQVINSISFYPPNASINNQYLATVTWSGWVRAYSDAYVTENTADFEFTIEEQTSVGGAWIEVKRVRSSTTQSPGGMIMAYRNISTPYYGARVRVSNVGLAQRWAKIVAGTAKKSANSLRVKLEDAATTITALDSYRPTGATYSTGGNDAANSGAGASLVRFTGSWTATFGWAESYKGDGSRRFDSEHLYQGFFNEQYGNQKSAAGNMIWQAQNGIPPVGAQGFRITSTMLTLNPLSWFENSGTLFVGTHNNADSLLNAIPSNYASIAGKNAGITKIDIRQVNTTVQKEVGPIIGQALYDRTAKGILLGPAPSNSKNWWGSFASSVLSVTINYEWYA